MVRLNQRKEQNRRRERQPSKAVFPTISFWEVLRVSKSFEQQILEVKDELLNLLTEGQFIHLLLTARKMDRGIRVEGD